MAKYFDGVGTAYIQQYRPEGMRKPFDFYFPDTNVLLEIQGDYWHNLDGSQERDEIKARIAIELGYCVYEIWEHDIHNLGVGCALYNVISQGSDLWKSKI